jgi:hypothetical protein
VTLFLLTRYSSSEEFTIMQLLIGAVAVVGIAVVSVLAMKALDWLRNRKD